MIVVYIVLFCLLEEKTLDGLLLVNSIKLSRWELKGRFDTECQVKIRIVLRYVCDSLLCTLDVNRAIGG